MDTAGATLLDVVALILHVLFSVCLRLIHKVDGVSLGQSLTDDPVGIIGAVEWTFDEFSLPICHIPITSDVIALKSRTRCLLGLYRPGCQQGRERE